MGWVRDVLLAGLCLAVLAGCDSGPQPPRGAVKVGEDFYLVPGDCDKFGYRQYHPWSRHQPVMPVIYYQTRDGGFSHDSSKSEVSADCD